MFRRMKLGTKIAGGFAAVLLFTAIVGGIGYKGLTGVDVIVDKADDGNRMIKQFQLVRQQEKNFVIRGDVEYAKKLNEEIDVLIEQARNTKDKMQVASDKALMDEILSHAGEYKEAFDQYAELAASKSQAGQDMVKSARDLQNMAEEIRQQQKAQLTDVQTKAEVALADKLWKADSANRIIKWATECRQQEKNYMLHYEQKYVKEVQRLTDSMMKLAMELESKFHQQVNKDQARDVLEAARAYRRGFDSYVAIYKKRDTANSAMVASGRRLLALGEQIAAVKPNRTGSDQQGDAAATSKVSTNFASRIVAQALQVRRREKDYMIRKDEAYIKKLRTELDKLVAAAKEAKADSSLGAHHDAIGEILTIAPKYFEQFEQVVAFEKQGAKILGGNNSAAEGFEDSGESNTTMVAAARRLESVAQTIRQQQKAQYDQVSKEARDNVSDKLAKADDANRMIKWALACRQGEKNYMLRADDKCAQDVRENLGKIDSLAKNLRDRFQRQENKDQVTKILTAASQYRTAFDGFVNMTHQQQTKEKEMVAAARGAQESCNESRKIQKEKMAATIASSNGLMIGGAVLAIVIGTLLGVFITRGITKPIRRIINGLTYGAQQTAAASEEVSSASQSLAQGASEQAAAIEETSSSVEEMTSMVKQNADNATAATELARNANSSATKGADSMGRMTQAIDDIKNSSDETAKILKTIDEIAFQTNLLALNAAVEAARAGEAGKGFAVVAEEVRNLAQRSAEAARNTATMLETSSRNADNGVQICREVNEVLSEIADGSSKVNGLVEEISGACQEQAQGIDQINQSVAQMDQVTQSNAANAEESASASEELSAQAEELNQMVHDLRNLIEGGQGSSSSTATQGAAFKAEKKTKKAVESPAHFAMTEERKHVQQSNDSESLAKDTEQLAQF